jgi:hypothetical protein
MMRILLAAALIFLANCDALLAIGPQLNLDKQFWQEVIVVTAVVEEVELPVKGSVVLTIRPTGLISGNFDPGLHPSIRIAYQRSVIAYYPQPKKGEKILTVVHKKADQNDFELPFVMVKAGDKLIEPIVILGDDERELPQALLESIRATRRATAMKSTLNK